MAVKTVTLSEDAYATLAALKREGRWPPVARAAAIRGGSKLLQPARYSPLR